MNGALGHTGVLLALAASLVGAAVLAVGLARHNDGLLRSARVYAWLVLAGAVVATVAMQRALLTHDFSLAFVAANNSRQTPVLYSITGMWSALAGSILLWGLILAGYLAAMVWRFRHRATDPLVAWATLTVLLVSAFFFGLMAGPSDPFSHVVGPIPTNGPGPNVLLQDNPLVAFHPPLLYLGFVGFTIPFAFAVASLVTGRIGEGWQLATRRWTLFAWACLTIGIMLGAWWSYQVLGWGGFWAWDPVENASFLPWLTATAFLHSVLVQERRGLLRVWNLSLVIATFSLTILGTFLTRSGVIQSVHAFSGSDIGPVLISFFAVVLIGGVGLIAWRGDRLRSPGGIDSPLSREGAFLVNNLLFVGFAFVVLLGTVFPLLYQAFTNQQVTVGAPYFDAMTLPIGLALLVLMAIGPALPWRKTTVGTLGDRLLVPAWGGGLVLVVCVAAGLRGLVPLVAFTLGGFAAPADLRPLALAARPRQRHGVGRRREGRGQPTAELLVAGVERTQTPGVEPAGRHRREQPAPAHEHQGGDGRPRPGPGAGRRRGQAVGGLQLRGSVSLPAGDGVGPHGRRGRVGGRVLDHQAVELAVPEGAAARVVPVGRDCRRRGSGRHGDRRGSGDRRSGHECDRCEDR